MPINFYASNNLEVLYDQLFENTNSVRMDVFHPLSIVTQTKGIEQWIKYRIADTKGIAANVKFLKPNDIIFKVYTALEGPSQVTFEAHYLTWMIFDIIKEDSFLSKFPQQALYIKDNEGHINEFKLYQFSKQLADLYDQYQIYRHDVLSNWEQSKFEDHHDWQAYIWSAIKDNTNLINKDPNQDHWSDKNDLAKIIFEGLKNSQKVAKLQQEIKAIQLFGLSVFTEYHLQLFYEIAAYIDVNFYVLNPASGAFWDDAIHSKLLSKLRTRHVPTIPEIVIEGNDLLLSWGGLMKSMLRIFFKNDAIINAYEVLALQEYDRSSLLNLIKYEIANNIPDQERSHINETYLLDGSIIIQNNFTHLREVETLYQYLVKCVENGTLTDPRDVLVMVTDIDVYAPYIHAVFSQKKLNFKYKIADEKPTQALDLLNALNHLLHINYRQFSANDLIELLSFKVFANLFNIHDLGLVKQLLNSANIIYGIENSTADDTYLFSWSYGLKRIMYGLCISEEPIINVDHQHLIPVDIIEGHASEIVLNLVGFVDYLLEFLKNTTQKYTVLEWLTLFEEKVLKPISLMFNDDNEQFVILSKSLDYYKKSAVISHEKISFNVFVSDFEHILNSSELNNNYIVGGITFCSLISMRSIPFKIIAVLGLDQQAFPRNEQQLSFDIMKQTPRIGDRNVRASDKYLLLETLFAARDTLYLSYIGRNIKDNSLLPPSGVIDDLVFYLQKKATVDVFNNLVIKQPLHKYSTSYNKGDERLYYYDDVTPAIKIPHKTKPITEIESVKNIITLRQLVSTLLNPAKNFVKQQYQIDFYQNDVTLKNEEVFSFENYGFENRIAQMLFDNAANREHQFQEDYLKGVWPLKEVGNALFKDINENIHALQLLFSNIDMNIQESSTYQLSYNINNIIIEGNIEGIVNDSIIKVASVKEPSIRNVYDIFLTAVLLKLKEKIHKCYIVFNSGIVIAYDFDQYDKEILEEWIQNVVSWYQRSFEELIIYNGYLGDDFKAEAIPALLHKILNGHNAKPQPALELVKEKWFDSMVQENTVEYNKAIFDFIRNVIANGQILTATT